MRSNSSASLSRSARRLAWISTGAPSAAKNSSSESLYAVRPYLCSRPRPYCPLSPRPLSRQICCFCHDQSSARCTHTPCCKSFSMPAVQSPCTHPQTAGFCCEMRMESMDRAPDMWLCLWHANGIRGQLILTEICEYVVLAVLVSCISCISSS